MIEEGKYIYSIIRKNDNRSFGLPYRKPEDFLQGSIGINNREVNLVHYKDISAVTSPTPVINFDRLDKKELTKYVAVHQKVNEEVMKEYDFVPMAFGIIAPSSDEVLHILERAYLQFKTVLQKVAGKTEFAVQIFLDRTKLLNELVNNNPEIKKLKAKAQSRLWGIGAKLKLGKLIFETSENKCKEYLRDVENSLKECSLDSQPGKLLDTPKENKLPAGQEVMIGNISFLIEKKAEPEFDKKMQELGKKYGRKLRFKYIGPMPPYSFVNINLSLGNFELINEARKLLRLKEEATFDEIKKAYYGLSHQYHPDKFQGGEEQMKKITQAYSILENYCQSCDEFFSADRQDMGKAESRKYSFKEKDVENSITIT